MRHLLLTALIVLSQSGAVFAQSVQDSVVEQLTAQGFEITKMRRTFLGRVRIEAQSEDLERELVFNPNTGEVLRDYWEARARNATTEDGEDGAQTAPDINLLSPTGERGAGATGEDTPGDSPSGNGFDGFSGGPSGGFGDGQFNGPSNGSGNNSGDGPSDGPSGSPGGGNAGRDRGRGN
ncbi:MAG: hypothetical protein AAGD04_05265 [Pseudomonadota bacterium]